MIDIDKMARELIEEIRYEDTMGGKTVRFVAPDNELNRIIKTALQQVADDAARQMRDDAAKRCDVFSQHVRRGFTEQAIACSHRADEIRALPLPSERSE